MPKENRIVVEMILHNGTSDGIMQITSTNYNCTCFKLPRNKVENFEENFD